VDEDDVAVTADPGPEHPNGVGDESEDTVAT
jgi:hypothetical protein